MPSFLRDFFSNLSGAQRLVSLILVLALSVTLIAFLAGGWKTGIPIGILVLALLWLTGPLWKPSEPGRTRIAIESLSLISAVALAVVGKTPEAKPWLTGVLGYLGLSGKTAEKILPLDHFTSALVLAFVLIAVFAINWLARDRSAMRKHPKPIDQDFPEQSYREQLKRYSKVLSGRLDTLDNETKWDDYFFAPLDAEVEVNSGRQSRKRIVDLMKALKENRTSRIVLVLGDPGSGKSIALRKLAKDLLNEVEKTGRLPVYVNLKEWSPKKPWTEQAPPTMEELREFVLESLKGQNLFADQFLDDYFDRMLDRGRLFFLLDSFDEIPAVLDVAEASWLVQRLSALISEFFLGQDQGRGVVASRLYRRPRLNRAESATFEIRPFSDIRIHEALMRSGKLRQETIDQLFTARAELIPVARNPFSAALIRLYAERHAGVLPSNQLEMFEDYIQSRLASSSTQTLKYQLNREELMAGAIDIAWCMFQAPEIGLEAPISRLVELLPNIPVLSITTVLKYSGLARLSSTADPRFSFVHRRLNEYCVSRRLLNNPASVNPQNIPTDSRYRDALALYCEVGDAKHVSEIANFCWNEISDAQATNALGTINLEQQPRAVHCLRFLRDAFRTRPDCLQFLPDLAEYIARNIQPRGDLLAAKLALEATGLLPETLAEPILVEALKTQNPWLSETTLHACRHLKRISEDLENRLYEYLKGIGERDFLHRYRELSFSLSLSDAFRRLNRYCVLRSVDSRMLVAAVVICAIMCPVITIGMAVTYLLMGAMNFLLGDDDDSDLFFIRMAFALILIAMAFYSRILGGDTFFRAFSPVLSTMHSNSALVATRVMYLACALAIAPWHSSSSAIERFWHSASSAVERFRWRSLSSLAAETVAAAAALGMLFGLGYAIYVLWHKWLSHFKTYLGWGFFIASGLFVLIKSILTLLATHRDWRHLRSRQAVAIDRSSISRDFRKFNTPFFRLKYVAWLRDNQVQPTGQWPEGLRPNVGDDASTLLAQLDERWLGLDG